MATEDIPPEPAKFSTGPPRRVFLLTYKLLDEVSLKEVIEREHFNVQSGVAVFCNGAEYQEKTDVIAINFDVLERVEDITSSPERPVTNLPPLSPSPATPDEGETNDGA